MLTNSINKLNRVAHSQWLWLAYLLGGFVLLLTALVYQYVFEELPCVMCIQVRLWISLLILVSIAGLLLRHNQWPNFSAHVFIVVIAVGLTERSYQLLGTEKGFVFGDCGFSLGFPAWFAIEEWLPWIYRVETSCGYTPEIIFGITMAEALMVMSVCLLMFSLCLAVASLFKSTASENAKDAKARK